MKRFQKYFRYCFMFMIITSIFTINNGFVSAASPTIQDINDHYQKYRGKTLTISGNIVSIVYESGNIIKVNAKEGNTTVYSAAYLYLLTGENSQIYLISFKVLKEGEEDKFKTKILTTSDQLISVEATKMFAKYIYKKYKIENTEGVANVTLGDQVNLDNFIAKLPRESSWVLMVDTESEPVFNSISTRP